jgi:hypothetical protein
LANSASLHRKNFIFQTVELHPLAPPKPPVGIACNGCGVCCAAVPCPVAWVFLWQRSGRCRALTWHDESKRYHCGMVNHPAQFSPVIPARFSAPIGRFFASRIAAGSGCDSSIELALENAD